MRTGGIKLGRIFGIDVSADLGVLFIAALLTWSLATAVLPQSDPGRVPLTYWSIAAVGTLVFLGSLLAHEFGHAIVARRNGIEVEGITLWLFGGVAQFKDDTTAPGPEFRIAAAGPAVSFLIGALALAGAYGLEQLGAADVYGVVLMWLGVINVFLAVFNLLPGAPLDGGHVLAAAIWKVRGDRLSARIWAARAGRVVGLVLVALGFGEVFLLQSMSGLWTAFIGWFLLSAARQEEAHWVGERALGQLPVSAAMLRGPHTVNAWTTVGDTVDGPLRTTGQTAVPVLDWEGRVLGVVTMDLVRRLPAERWGSTPVNQLMVPVQMLATTTPGEMMTELVDRLRSAAGGVAVVLDGGRLVGMVTPVEVQRAITLGRLTGRSGVARSGTPPHAGPPPPPSGVPHQQWDAPAS